MLDAVVEQIHEMLIVAAVELDEHGVAAGGEMAFHDFRNGFELHGHVFIHGAALQFDADVGAGGISNAFGANGVARTCDDTCFNEALHALMNGGARDSADGCHIFKRNTSVD